MKNQSSLINKNSDLNSDWSNNSSEPLKQVKYALNNNEALQLIWKGALFDLKKAFP